ncbi:hypothetical protein DH2020_050013 [Rehmannia glutinosa]|uniref:Uncharacterized protein n=1 Tax=Rehmannia glutinosa TaxID=99300 RepID=A0ABR0U1U5_REHGL
MKICSHLKTSKEVPDDGKQLRNDWEITSASQKLAECQETIRNLGKQLKALASSRDASLFDQETIRNLGKQLKALASSRDASLFDKVITTPADPVITTSMSTPPRNGSQRLSLLEKMLAEDNNNQSDASSKPKDASENSHSNPAVSTNAATESWSKFTDPNRISDADRNAVVSVAVVPCKKNESMSFLKKLIWWQKKGNSKKTPFS